MLDVRGLNRIALALAVAVFASLGAWWWHDRTRGYETPRWDPARFVRIAPPVAVAADQPRWIVAVNPACPHCGARLAQLSRRRAAQAHGATLGVLYVDCPRLPGAPDSTLRLDAGAWWDSAGTWRSAWGHRAYGETLEFDARGALQRVIPPSADPMDPALR